MGMFQGSNPLSPQSLGGNTYVIDQNSGAELKFWYGSSEEYNAILEKDDNTIYFLSDSSLNDINPYMEKNIYDPNNIARDLYDYIDEQYNHISYDAIIMADRDSRDARRYENIHWIKGNYNDLVEQIRTCGYASIWLTINEVDSSDFIVKTIGFPITSIIFEPESYFIQGFFDNNQFYIGIDGANGLNITFNNV